MWRDRDFWTTNKKHNNDIDVIYYELFTIIFQANINIFFLVKIQLIKSLNSHNIRMINKRVVRNGSFSNLCIRHRQNNCESCSKATKHPRRRFLKIHVLHERLSADIALERQRTMNLKGRCMNIDPVFTRQLMRFARDFCKNFRLLNVPTKVGHENMERDNNVRWRSFKSIRICLTL